MTDATFPLQQFPVHLGRGATAAVLPEMDGTSEWFRRYGESHGGDGAEGRLVTMFTFAAPWDTWEVHPNGHELVVCTAGEMTLHQEVDGGVRTVTLRTGDAAINPPGVWHTADVEGSATALFVTAGLGTENRAR
jgi:quercetin dioxygenase-like cupin family protein